MAELEKLSQRLAADDAGRGGDGRELSPDDNGGPRMVDSQSLFVTYAVLGLFGVGASAGFFINRDALLKHLEDNGFSLEQFLEALRDVLS